MQSPSQLLLTVTAWSVARMRSRRLLRLSWKWPWRDLLLMPVHQRLRLLVFALRTNDEVLLARHEISRFPCKERLHMPGSPTTPGALALARPSVLPSAI